MPINDVMSEKKKALIAYKQKILQEIQYYDKRIDDIRSQGKKNHFSEIADSSDSEDEITFNIDYAPSVPELKQQQASLRTCLQATQELASLQVLQSEVNVLVDDPEIIGEPPVTEPGVWREVTAECRVDLVPFSINFFVHQPDRKFGPLSYRGLRVSPVKTAHEGELSRSVLPSLTKPSDAIEVLKSFSAAQRSRRSTLARLADKFANTLYMEPMPEGGYVLKCANLLEVSWTLQNKWSPIAPFHHRMKFDLEYMDESYIKTITQVHRQLSNPAIDTDERTMLLAKIISICLEAQGPTQELYESMSSDPEVAQSLRSRRTTLDREPEHTDTQRHKHTDTQRHKHTDKQDRNVDREVMAPPKSLPKKAKKPKGKENIVDNRKETFKRSNSNEEIKRSKKHKTDTNLNRHSEENATQSTEKVNENTELNHNNQAKNLNTKNRDSVASNKNNDGKVANKNNTETSNKVTSAKNDAETETSKSVEKNNVTKKKGDVGNPKDVQKKLVDPNKKVLSKEKSDLDGKVKNNPKTADKNDIVAMVKEKSKENLKGDANTNKKLSGKEKSDLDANDVVKVKNNAKTADNIVNKVPLVKEKSNDKLKGDTNNKKTNEKEGKSKTIPTNKETHAKNSTNANKNTEVIKESNNFDNTEKSNFNQGKENQAKMKIVNDKTDVNTKNNNKETVNNKPKSITNIVPKDNVKNQVNKDTGKKIPTISSKVKKDAILKTTDKKFASNVENNKVSKTPGVVTSKSVPKPNQGTTIVVTSSKVNKDQNVKTVQKAILNKNQDKAEKAQLKAKSVAIIKKTQPNKDQNNQVKKSLAKTDKQIPNKDIESTIEKVVEKRQSVAMKRKSNLLDRHDNENNPGGKKKILNNEIVDTIISGNTTEVNKVKTKINVVKRTPTRIASNKIMPSQNIKKPITEIKKNDNYQKAIKNKTEIKLKTKFNPGIKTVSGNTKVLAGNTDKGSKIPQKKLSAGSEALLKKNPLRISPRKIPSKFKTVDAKLIQKTTSIPRLLKKPAPKT